MLFNSLPFIVFFAIVFVVYWCTPWHRPRLAVLLLASWFFYAWWHPSYLVLFLIITALNYASGRIVGSLRAARRVWATRWMIAAIVANIGTLAYFKYLDFTLENVSALWDALTGAQWEPTRFDIFLPLGISFYTFQMTAYVVDVHQFRANPIRNPLKMSLFIAFFPQLVAGPIVRTHEFIPQLASKRRFDGSAVLHGLDLIALGMLKKVLIADQIAPFVDSVFARPEGLGSGTLLLASYAYAVQIYCDFSGYTDIGRGCAHCLGYKLPINFARPYLAGNIISFWRRWHVTLSHWLRDYLYIPLGGNRKGRERTYVNLMLTMAIGGLWHGAMWTFVAWGLIHGAALSITRFIHEQTGRKPEEPLIDHPIWKLLAVVGTFHLVTMAWVFFRATSFGDAFTIIRGILRFDFMVPLPASDLAAIESLDPMIALAAVLVLPTAHLIAAWLRAHGAHRTLLWAAGRPVFYGALVACILLYGRGQAQQFIYFQF
jgi:alginate O-acetyltransferase complex protein AlgI